MKLHEHVRAILSDKAVRDELMSSIQQGRTFLSAARAGVTREMLKAVVTPEPSGPVTDKAPRPRSEAVVARIGRPSLLVRNNKFETPELDTLKQRLLPRRATIERCLPSVGRVELINLPSRPYGGSGWMIAERTIVTNRHVAELFAERKGSKAVWLKNFMGQQIGAKIDFREEYEVAESFEVGVDEVIYLEKSDNALPDVAFLKLSSTSTLPEPLRVATGTPVVASNVAVIGYPGRDPEGGNFDLELLNKLFGDVYSVKRLSPGLLTGSAKNKWYFTHDATTLRGSSGSVILDIDTGHAVGLHFQGEWEAANYAVRADVLQDRMAKLKLKVTKPAFESPAVTDDDLVGEPEAPESYADREGFDTKFLGKDATVPLPLAKSAQTKKDQLKVSGDGVSDNILHYTHFSVAMSSSRRLCLWSAVNIDGKEAKSIKGQRPRWRFDSRFDTDQQIRNECYGEGSEGKFSRGHMTRREDPNWGPMELARVANRDTFHVTNACPQIQPFNGGVWLGLEDYALENAKQDDMRISVITGPFFDFEGGDSDPEYFGVRIPIHFWKIIAFIHDQTGKLTATGYRMSQKSFLRGPEFVYGAYETYQTSIELIERKTGLSFGGLKQLDPYKAQPESLIRPIINYSDIRLIP
jgi:endonuclease G